MYGLGADALNPEAVARVFEAKGRPSFGKRIVLELSNIIIDNKITTLEELKQKEDEIFTYNGKVLRQETAAGIGLIDILQIRLIEIANFARQHIGNGRIGTAVRTHGIGIIGKSLHLIQ